MRLDELPQSDRIEARAWERAGIPMVAPAGSASGPSSSLVSLGGRSASIRSF
jgi:hypothetical protein